MNSSLIFASTRCILLHALWPLSGRAVTRSTLRHGPDTPRFRVRAHFEADRAAWAPVVTSIVSQAAIFVRKDRLAEHGYDWIVFFYYHSV